MPRVIHNDIISFSIVSQTDKDNWTSLKELQGEERATVAVQGAWGPSIEIAVTAPNYKSQHTAQQLSKVFLPDKQIALPHVCSTRTWNYDSHDSSHASRFSPPECNALSSILRTQYALHCILGVEVHCRQVAGRCQYFKLRFRSCLKIIAWEQLTRERSKQAELSLVPSLLQSRDTQAK